MNEPIKDTNKRKREIEESFTSNKKPVSSPSEVLFWKVWRSVVTKRVILVFLAPPDDKGVINHLKTCSKTSRHPPHVLKTRVLLIYNHPNYDHIKSVLEKFTKPDIWKFIETGKFRNKRHYTSKRSKGLKFLYGILYNRTYSDFQFNHITNSRYGHPGYSSSTLNWLVVRAMINDNIRPMFDLEWYDWLKMMPDKCIRDQK
ncbi:hypothetical protein DDB_G0280661 [Dictyostelium discoideum AX4]|uniref:Uncharacterized protein n=1 Tax=Dictyostelium discoideum TaxID=44689 RepID=Q54V22_DICDI|nr:hypothetical protein DDB_G0280661 [Dictyostelium discoideum AX4]EAL67132.1 hypothetical protein DDB_G0280661 [Dictyostelium discoideum AX4]|eukprot:XP_641109.1 hypothetical protein DDB_G0280661 [Dictyostelium discoideum AX4]